MESQVKKETKIVLTLDVIEAQWLKNIMEDLLAKMVDCTEDKDTKEAEMCREIWDELDQYDLEEYLHQQQGININIIRRYYK